MWMCLCVALALTYRWIYFNNNNKTAILLAVTTRSQIDVQTVPKRNVRIALIVTLLFVPVIWGEWFPKEKERVRVRGRGKENEIEQWRERKINQIKQIYFLSIYGVFHLKVEIIKSTEKHLCDSFTLEAVSTGHFLFKWHTRRRNENTIFGMCWTQSNHVRKERRAHSIYLAFNKTYWMRRNRGRETIILSTFSVTYFVYGGRLKIEFKMKKGKKKCFWNGNIHAIGASKCSIAQRNFVCWLDAIVTRARCLQQKTKNRIEYTLTHGRNYKSYPIELYSVAW